MLNCFTKKSGCRVKDDWMQSEYGKSSATNWLKRLWPFACVYAQLLNKGKNRSQFSFNQLLLRDTFNTFLETGILNEFSCIHSETTQPINEIILSWRFRYIDKYTETQQKFANDTVAVISEYTIQFFIFVKKNFNP